MADLRVDYAVLDGVHAAMAQIAQEFESLHERRDLDKRVWGGSGIRSAMDDFASNWDRHRQDLTESVQKLSEHCAAIAASFRAVDRTLGAAAGHRSA